VLDDNRKLTLVTGECIPLTSRSTVIIEGADLRHCSPATVSRCGIMCMADKLVSTKALFNNYVNNLPHILSDLAWKLDQMVVYFFPDLLEQFLGDESLMIYPVTDKHAIQNFLKHFEAFIADYRSENYQTWSYIAKMQAQLLQLATGELKSGRNSVVGSQAGKRKRPSPPGGHLSFGYDDQSV
jgi:dynein heavy chain